MLRRKKRMHNILSIWDPLTQQRVFRYLLKAFSYPGLILPLSEISDLPALTMVLAALIDREVTLSDPHKLLSFDDWQRLGAIEEKPEKANFIIAKGNFSPDFTPLIGTLESPELGATVILQLDKLAEGEPYLLSGPGVEGKRKILLKGLNKEWLEMRDTCNRVFPLGIDIILIDNNKIVAIPRATLVDFNGGF